ncbi:MAG: hypothetical protein A2163_08195 [Actinobacteria bacterium RBG_13_35_12]|nr:MAG: hypothetical protein A2163_08195 [Actinobacteria bacterium RBG_13_35_12]
MSQPVICIAGHRYYTEKQGGVELQTRYIGDVLAEAGWKVVFLSPSLNRKTGREEINQNISVWWYPHFSFEFQTPQKLIERMLNEINPSVVYQRGIGQIRGCVLQYTRKKRIPYIFAFSTDKDIDNWYLTKTNFEALIPLWKKIVLIPYILWLEKKRKYVLRNADYIIVQHEDQLNKVKDKLRIEPHLFRTIHPELNHEVRKSNEKTVLWVNNYRPLKQGEIFVRLAEQCMNLNCSFIMIYGKTKHEYIAPVLEKAQNVNNLTLIGEISYEASEKFMEESSLFVNTSSFEGFPNTFVQSWLRETPTVSLNVNPGGVLTREKIGMCSGNFGQMVKDVTYLIENDKERIEMGKRARAYAEKEHGFENNKDKIVQFFTEVVTKKEIIS